MDDRPSAQELSSAPALPIRPAVYSLDGISPQQHVSQSKPAGRPRLKSDSKCPKLHRLRTFQYLQQLPYEVETDAHRDAALADILKQLYIALEAGDFSPGALRWTQKLKSWLSLKFGMTKELRAKLARLYHSLAVSPGLDPATSEAFGLMVLDLTRKIHYLEPGRDLILDWRPLWNQVKAWVLPREAPAYQRLRQQSLSRLLKLCNHMRTYFDATERYAMMEEFLPFFSVNDLPNAYVVVGALNTFLPSHPATPGDLESQPNEFFPALFHIWAIINRSRDFDISFIELFSRMAWEHLSCTHIPFHEYGIFTKEQSDLILTAFLRLTSIQGGRFSSPYTHLDTLAGIGAEFSKMRRKDAIAHAISRLIVSSLSPICLNRDGSIMASFEELLESIETFHYPPNSGPWTDLLGQSTQSLAETFVLRWNQEQSGELSVPAERRINRELKKRFVLSLRNATFLGLYSKKSQVSSCYCKALQQLAYLEPELMLPGALQRFYPSLQSSVKCDETTTSLKALRMVANILSKRKGYRCHLTALLTLALRGIDVNDLTETRVILDFIQTVAYSVSIAPLSPGGRKIPRPTLAAEWVQRQMKHMEEEGQDVVLDYENNLDDEEEVLILISSTLDFRQFVDTLLEKVFTLLENMPTPSNGRASTPEGDVSTTLPTALLPIFASLSPELFETASMKISTFISQRVVHQACDTMSSILNMLCQVNPGKTLEIFIPQLTSSIRNEIEDNNAASDCSSGTECLPRDQALVWHISMLSMAVLGVGSEVLRFKRELVDIAEYMQAKCRGSPASNVSRYIHDLLLNLTHMYPMDHALCEPSKLRDRYDPDDWGRTTPPSELTIHWHRPSPPEVEFAVDLFISQTQSALDHLDRLMSDDPPTNLTGRKIEWSVEFSRLINHIKLVTAGMATMFDPVRASSKDATHVSDNQLMVDDDERHVDKDPLVNVVEDNQVQLHLRCHTGYVLSRTNPAYARIHNHRDKIGRLLAKAHIFLSKDREVGVDCFKALYDACCIWLKDVGIERSARPLSKQQRSYKARIDIFRMQGLRKAYPRPMLVMRAKVYQLLRLQRSTSTRRMCELDRQLLLYLAEFSLSSDANIGNAARSSLRLSSMGLIGAKSLTIPVILKHFKHAIEMGDSDRICGGLRTLFFTPLTETVLRDWRFAPEAVRLCISGLDNTSLSVRQLASRALHQANGFGDLRESLVIVDKKMISIIAPLADTSCAIRSRKQILIYLSSTTEESRAAFALELVEQAKTAHWNIAIACIKLATNLCLGFDNIAPAAFIDLVVTGALNSHPDLRSRCIQSLNLLFQLIAKREIYSCSYRNYLIGDTAGDVNKMEIHVEEGDAAFTQSFLESFEHPRNPRYLVHSDSLGWLVWPKKFTAYRARSAATRSHDDVHVIVVQQIGKILTKGWLCMFFAYLKQEPEDTEMDDLRMHLVYALAHVFNFTHRGMALIRLDDIKELIQEVYDDGGDKNQHRATSEILAALLAGSREDPPEQRTPVWEFAAPMLLKIFSDDLTPENMPLWQACLDLILSASDPRCSHEIVDSLKSVQLNASSDAAFKESCKLQLLNCVFAKLGWHFRHEKPILDDLLTHLSHPYCEVRKAMGSLLSLIYKTRYHESFQNVNTFLKENRAASSVGLRPYRPTDNFFTTIHGVFEQIERRQAEMPSNQQDMQYHSGLETALIWMNRSLSSHECIQLVSLIPHPLLEQLLRIMDVDGDPDLITLARHIFLDLPNIPFQDGEDVGFTDALIRIGRTSTSWRHRRWVLKNMETLYLRRIILSKKPQRDLMYEAVLEMLRDSQPEVRDCAASTLAVMLRCSPHRIRDPIVDDLVQRFKETLLSTSLSNQRLQQPRMDNSIILKRHASILGLGALLGLSPPYGPLLNWVPDVLSTLARMTSGDTGLTGKAAKNILSEFKRSNRDAWPMHQKFFSAEQLCDLEGVLCANYIA